MPKGNNSIQGTYPSLNTNLQECKLQMNKMQHKILCLSDDPRACYGPLIPDNNCHKIYITY